MPTPTRSRRPWISSCAPSRCGTPRGVRLSGASAGPASCSTSTSAPAPASARSPRRAPADRRGLRDLHGRAHPADPAAAGGRDAPGRRGAQLRAGGPAARPAGQRPQGHGTPADGVLDPGGLRHRRLRRGRPGAAVQVFFVRQGRVVGRRGWKWSTRSRPSTPPRPGRHLRPAALRRPGRRGPARGVPARPARAPTLCGPGWPGCAAGASTSGCRAGGEAGPAGDGRGQRPRGPSPPTSSSGPATSTPGPGASRAPGSPWTCRGPAADRVLRHLQPPGQPGGGLDGGVRGRPRPQEQYRRFEVRSVEGQDDVASLREVLTRRLAAWPPSATSRRTKRGAARSSPTRPT